MGRLLSFLQYQGILRDEVSFHLPICLLFSGGKKGLRGIFVLEKNES